MKTSKRILSAVLACMLVLSMGCLTAFAAETEHTETPMISATETIKLEKVEDSSGDVSVASTGLFGYGCGTGSSATFNVVTTGESKQTGYITIRVEGASNQSGDVHFVITGPGGGRSDVWDITPYNGQEQKFTFSSAPVGTYEVHYWTTDPEQNVKFNCWIYG